MDFSFIEEQVIGFIKASIALECVAVITHTLWYMSIVLKAFSCENVLLYAVLLN